MDVKAVLRIVYTNNQIECFKSLQDSIEERHRHRYEVNPEMVDQFEAAGMKFVGHDSEHKRMEIMELENHPFYVAVQYHPEYISRPMRPSPPYLGLILAATGKLQAFLAKVIKIKCSFSNKSCFCYGPPKGDSHFYPKRVIQKVGLVLSTEQ